MVLNRKLIPLELAIKADKSICQIKIKSKKGDIIGSGFFMKVFDSLRYLITTNIIINENVINNSIEIKIFNGKKFNLTFSERFYKFFQNPIDITAIEIKKSDSICKDIEFLDYDSNYSQEGYSIYKIADVFSFASSEYISKKICSGNILDINGNVFYHDLSVNKPGYPIILLSYDKDLIEVIGVHIESGFEISGCKIFGNGIFIGEIIEEIKLPIKTNTNFINIDNNLETNYIFNNNESKINFIDDNFNKNLIINNNKKDLFINNDNNHNNKINFNCNKNSFNSVKNTIDNNSLINNKINNNYNKLNINFKINPNNNLINNNLNLSTINNKSNNNFNQNTKNSLNNNSINISNISLEKRKIEKSLILSNDLKNAITLHFESSDQSVNYLVRCNNDDRFNMVVNKILEKELKLIEKGFVFLCKGNKINEYKTIKDNNLKNGDVIILQLFD